MMRIWVGLTVGLLITAAQAQTLTVLHSFGTGGDGTYPESGLVQGKDGYFYGTTLGTVYRISSSGAFTNLYSFSPPSGAMPFAALVQGADSNFYGTTTEGTGNNYGTIFRISPAGTLTNLYNISTNGSDGDDPMGALVQGTDGNFYGTMGFDGDTNADHTFDGTVFRISPSGVFTNLHRFLVNGLVDGFIPLAGIIQGNDGWFYGTTVYGGTNGAGTVFKISSSGTLTTIYNFSGGADGGGPLAKLVQGSDGWFYGTTTPLGGTGTVFRISSTGTFTVLHTLPLYNTDVPLAALVEGTDGWFYGAYPAGGVNNSGMVFRVSAGGEFSTLYSFSGPDGAYPQGTLVRGSDGWFYGTTYWGGANSCYCGTVFKFSAPPVPPEQISRVQVGGTNVLITVPGIFGKSYQLQYRNSLTTGTWANVGGSVSNASGWLMVTNFGGAVGPQGFYRFAIAP